MGSHHTGGEYPGDGYPPDDRSRDRQTGRRRAEPDPGPPSGQRNSGRGGYGGAPTNPYHQAGGGRPGNDRPQGGGYREEPTGRHATQPRGGYQPPRQEQRRPGPGPSPEPGRPAGPAQPGDQGRRPTGPRPAEPGWNEHGAPSTVTQPPPSSPEPFQPEPLDRNPYHPDLADGPASTWDDDQSTEVYSHLGYVPKPERRPQGGDAFGDLSARPGDGKKFKTMRRARRASGLTRTLIAAGVVVVLALIGGGAWLLFDGEEGAPGETVGKYAVLEQPCTMLDTAPLADLSLTEDDSRHRESSEPKSDGAEQVCAIAYNAGDDTAVDVAFDARVYDSEAKARNDWEFKHDKQQTQAEGGWNLTELSGIGEQAFALSRSWDPDAGAADYRIHLWDGNVSVETTLTIYSREEVSDEDLSTRAAELAKAYLAKWAAG